MQALRSLKKVVQREIDDPMTGRVGVLIVDLERVEDVISHNADETFFLASLSKIFTVGAAFEHLGPSTTFTTRLAATDQAQPDGVLDGDLVITGGGDPTFGIAQHVNELYEGKGTSVDQFAELLHSANITRVTGQLVVDGSLFESDNQRQTDWMTALTFNRSRYTEPLLGAANAITEFLKTRGVAIDGGASTGTHGATDRVNIGSVQSPTVRDLAIRAGHASDNFVSEILTKHIAAKTSSTGKGSIAGGITQVSSHAGALGARVNLINGSGQKHVYQGRVTGNRGTPRQIINYLRALRSHPLRDDFEACLPRSSKDGTLETRMRNTEAIGKVRAKTGTLTLDKKPLQDSLAGYCHGHRATMAFALILDRASSRFVARSSLDRMGDAIAKYSDRVS